MISNNLAVNPGGKSELLSDSLVLPNLHAVSVDSSKFSLVGALVMTTPSMSRRLTSSIQSQDANTFRGLIERALEKTEVNAVLDWAEKIISEFSDDDEAEYWAKCQLNNADNPIPKILANSARRWNLTLIRWGFLPGRDFICNKEQFLFTAEVEHEMLRRVAPLAKNRATKLFNDHVVDIE